MIIIVAAGVENYSGGGGRGSSGGSARGCDGVGTGAGADVAQAAEAHTAHAAAAYIHTVGRASSSAVVVSMRRRKKVRVAAAGQRLGQQTLVFSLSLFRKNCRIPMQIVRMNRTHAAKVAQLGMSAGGDHHVVWFNVSVNYSVCVKMTHCQADLCDEVLRDVFGQPFHAAEQRQTVPAVHVFHDQKQLVLALEGEQKLHEIVRVSAAHHHCRALFHHLVQ
mmetsp:Transcript_61752/g.108503  ORF Transcript_61752/g.108503 Transcript_61752/m.108503 type:complete len:220 (+) Transcript_61752:2557-3216(+)